MFKDGDIVYVTLKNRGQKNAENVDEEWYEKAFGPKQNIMTIQINFTPESKDAFKRGKYDIYAEVEYNMYEEMQPEFNKADYKVKELIKLRAEGLEISPTETNYIYDKKLEYPYGDIKIVLKSALAGKAEEDMDP